MALPGKGGDRTSDAVKDVRSALELAQDGTADQGVLDRQSTKFVQNILDLGVDGKGWFDSAAHEADEALRENGGGGEGGRGASRRRPRSAGWGSR